MKEIRAQEKSIKDLLSEKYALDSYQREYKWEEKQIDDLTKDLLSAFDGHYQNDHKLIDVKRYGQYFLGPIIVSANDDKSGDSKRYIIDGQQRLTTLTLAMICLLHLSDDEDQKTSLRNLIYSSDFGEKSFNLDVPERTQCLQKLYDGEEIHVDSEPESVRNLVARHDQIKDKLSESLEPQQIPLFIAWLINHVHLVEIKASSDADAYSIFETMNDRGLRLTPAEMLKGYLLSEITSRDARTHANGVWKNQIDALADKKGDDTDAIKSWLRARHAEKLTDFDEIGSRFHRWVRDNKDTIGLCDSESFIKFIGRDFSFYAEQFMRLRRAAEKYDVETGLECVHYLAQHDFTLQYPLLLAALTPTDSPRNILCKLRVVATYLDILIHRRIGNWKRIAESSMRDKIFNLIPIIRNKCAAEIADMLATRLEQEEPGDTLDPNFAMHATNSRRIKRILARITDYVEKQSANVSSYAKYFERGKKAFQIEHIWHANYAEVCCQESATKNDLSEDEFWTMRNRIGGLLLLPQKDNASYGARPYTEKREYYQTQNLLAGSLHQNCYAAKTGLRQFKENSELPFDPHPEFKIVNMEKRQKLYCAIADKIWDSRRLQEIANKS